MADQTTMTASVVINLIGNLPRRTAEFTRAIGQMDAQSTRHLAHIRQGVTATAASFDRVGQRAILGTTAAATAAGYIFKNTFLEQAQQMERYRTSAKSLFGADGAGAAMNWAQQNAQNTTFALNDVIESMTMLKGFDLDPAQVLPTFEDVAAAKGWSPDTAKGIMRQIGQMWSKGRMLQEDVGILQEQGLNPVGILAKATGKTNEQIMDLQSKGKLGRDAIRLLLAELQQMYKGASVDAMGGLNGSISNLGDTWDRFQMKVMDDGVSDTLIKQLHALQEWYAAAEKSGELDEIVGQLSTFFKTVIEDAPKAAHEIAALAKEINNIAQAMGGWETIGKGIAALYAARAVYKVSARGLEYAKTARGAAGELRDAWRGGKGGKGGVSLPGLDDGLMRVYVVNWPGGGMDYGEIDGGDSGSGKRKGRPSRRRGRGGSRATPSIPKPKPVTPKPPTTSTKVGPWRRVGRTLAAAEKGVPLLNAAVTGIEFMSADNNKQRGEALGAGAGAAIGAGIGTVLLPGLGTVIGGILGDYLGRMGGGYLGERFDDKKSDSTPQEKTKGEIKVTLDLPPGVKAKSVQAKSDDYQMAFYLGAPWGGS